MGADEVYHLSDEAFLGGDAYATAKALAAAINTLGDYDAVFCGKQAVDEDNAAVGIMLAEMLDLPHVSVVSKLEIMPMANRPGPSGTSRAARRSWRLPLPAVITAQKGLNEPRYPSFRGIRQARSKPFTQWTVADVGLDAGRRRRSWGQAGGRRDPAAAGTAAWSHHPRRARRSGQRGGAAAARRSKGHLGGESWETMFWSLLNSETVS